METKVWTPNTCDCSFVVNVNTDLPSELIDFIFVEVLRNDGLHGVLTGAALLTAAHNDNRLMNNVLREALKIQPSLIPGNYFFSFDSKRILNVSFALAEGNNGPGAILSNAKKATLREAVNALFGLEKVNVT